jgi:hypothetical protein
MNRCPACNTLYSDETLRYCLADGSLLEDDEQATIVRPGAAALGETVAMNHDPRTVRVDIPVQQNALPRVGETAEPARNSSGWLLKALLAVIGIAALATILIGAAAFFYLNRNETSAAANTRGAPASASPSPAATANDTDELRDQIANLERLVNEQKKTGHVPAAAPDQPLGTTRTARVNSPGDHFLALRSLPSSDMGTRVLQIPDGSTVSINGCLNAMRLGSKSGRWCRASYNGYSGWVFDAWLIY